VTELLGNAIPEINLECSN